MERETPEEKSDALSESMAAMPFWSHLVELRERLLKSLAGIAVGVVLSIAFLERMVFDLALKPLGSRKLMYLGLAEGFTTHLFLSLIIGTILALPYVAYQIWAFVAPGLYPRERRVAVRLSFASTGLFFAGVLFAYFILMPVVVRFFLSFETDQLVYGGALGSYLKTFAGLLLGTGLAFQFPLVLLGLVRAGIVTPESLAAQRGYWILAIVTLAAVLTPTGDMMTQSLVSLPMWILFEGAVILSKGMEVRSKEKGGRDEKESS